MSSTATAYSRASTSSAATAPSQRVPLSLEELSKSARVDWDSSRDFKFWLKLAEKTRHSGQAYDQYGDLESAFVEYAKASTLILEKIPLHRDYMTRLDDVQRATLKTKGQGLRDRMNELKPELVDRHNAWEEMRDRNTSQTPSRSPQPSPSIRDDDKRSRSREPSRKESISEQNGEGNRAWYPDSAADKRRYDELTVPQAQPKLRSPRSRAEHDGILQRQREAEDEWKIARKSVPHESVPSPYAQPGYPPLPSPGAVSPQRTTSLTSSNGTTSSIEPPPLLPLESPGRRYDGDSTDPENDYRDDDRLYKRVANLTIGRDDSALFGGPVIPPITTTSPPPSTFTSITYPQLMTHHQRTQGYSPSLQSMFMHPNPTPSRPTILFDGANAPSGPSPMPSLYQNLLPSPSMPIAERSSPQPNKIHMYGPRETPVHQARGYSPPSRRPPLPTPQLHRPVSDSFQHPRSLPGVPPMNPAVLQAPRIIHTSAAERDERVSGELRQVNFPRVVLPRFIAIAAVNTAKNRETCGLLMGKAKGSKLIVTTLLIPKQYSTSDTCQMNEEELILEFSETRSLMTLGWIHTHPTQSCFMSSVDLHTHSGLQQMLPESFAVVCAPQHTPNFGIFRLTDPPGLQSILHCKEKSAFHPHPDIPIYTDADKGHVQMKDLPLEIVDLR